MDRSLKKNNFFVSNDEWPRGGFNEIGHMYIHIHVCTSTYARATYVMIVALTAFSVEKSQKL
jgi:hypothetical protein